MSSKSGATPEANKKWTPYKLMKLMKSSPCGKAASEKHIKTVKRKEREKN